MFSCKLPRALLAQWPASVMCYCGNTAVGRISNWNQHSKFTLETKTKQKTNKTLTLCSFRGPNSRPFLGTLPLCFREELNRKYSFFFLPRSCSSRLPPPPPPPPPRPTPPLLFSFFLSFSRASIPDQCKIKQLSLDDMHLKNNRGHSPLQPQLSHPTPSPDFRYKYK